jgi:hypothetical protein
MARNYKQGTLAQRLLKKAEDELEISKNADALFQMLKPEYDRWDQHKLIREDPRDPNSPIVPPPGPKINTYVIRTAVDNMVSSEKDLAFSEDLREAADIVQIVQVLRGDTELCAAARRLTGALDGSFRYNVYRGEAPEGVPTSKRDQALVLLSLGVLGVS